ncbi:unnamed protein product [Heligmosomoides polygyrus]|uniref:Reverse transcriptase domain-containing protein n=1 Tax=Heligmosomoides polygyrus TaxID=6339 RepID=A0A183FYE2_HELPZ|nr:unnamed protein product [Heligmosomoides polygyrus]
MPATPASKTNNMAAVDNDAMKASVEADPRKTTPDDESEEDQVWRHRTDRDEKTPPLHDAYDSGEELFLGTCDSRGVDGVGVLVNMHLAMNTFESLTSRVGRLRLKRCGSVPALTVFVAYALTSDYDDEEVEAFYVELEKFYKEDRTFYKVIVGDINAKIGPRRSPEKTTHRSPRFGKPPSLRWTWESPGGQFHNEIDHIIFNRKYCLTDVSVVPKFYMGSDHRLLRARFRLWRQGEMNPRTTINRYLYSSLYILWEDAVMDNVDEEYDRFLHHLSDSAKGAKSLKTTKRHGYSCHGGFGFGSRNADGERILEYAESHDLTIVNTRFRKRESHLISFYSGNSKTQIDFVLVRNRDQGLVTDAKVVPYETVATQHRPLICTMRITPPMFKQVERSGPSRIKWWRLKEKEAAVISRLQLPTVTTVDETLKNAADATLSAARSELDTTKPGRRKVDRQTWLWTNEVKEKVREKKRLYHAFLDDKTADKWRLYQETKKAANKGGQ